MKQKRGKYSSDSAGERCFPRHQDEGGATGPGRGALALLRGDRGLALLTSVVVIFLLTTLGTAYMLSAVSEQDMVTNQAFSTRAIFSADSGVEAGLQQVSNYAADKLSDLVDTWPGSGPIITDPEGFFPNEGFSHNWTDPVYAITTSLGFVDSILRPEAQNYDYVFSIRSSGLAGVFGRRRVRAEGEIRVTASRGTFADFLLYTDEHLTEGGSPIWFHTSGNFGGRIHTNTIHRFAYFPTFHDLVTSVDPMAWYYNRGWNVKLDADRNGSRDVPNFFGGFRRGFDEVSLPPNSFSQLRASLGLDASDMTEPTEAEIREALGLEPGVTPPPDGVYVLNDSINVTAGIFVQGDVDDLDMHIDGNGNQVMSFTHINGDLVDVTIDLTNNLTTVNYNSVETTYQGTPPRESVYARGATNALHGPDRNNDIVVPGIQRDYQVLFTSRDDIVITGDIQYEDFDDGTCVLGIFTPEGNVRIGTSAPDELVIDAYIMASGTNKCFTVDNFRYRSYAGQVHLRGGVSTSRYGAFGTFGGGGMTGYGRDFRYDYRGYIPPFWPATLVFVPNEPQPRLLTWVEE